MTRDSASWDRGSRTPLALLIVALVGGAAPAPVQSQDGPALERHLVIGEGSAVDGPTFTMISAMELGPDERELYVADRSGIRIFDLEGTLLRALPLVGPGPGQAQLPLQIHLTRDRLSLMDGADGTLSWFSLEGAFQGRRRLSSFEVEESRHTQAPRPVRHDQWVIRTSPVTGTGIRAPVDRYSRDFLLDPSGERLRELGAYHVGRGYYVWADRPDDTFGSRLEYGGSGGHASILGDSMYVHADGYLGIVSWHLIDEREVRLIRRRELGWEPEPFPMSAESVKVALAQERGVPVSEVTEVVLPEFMGLVEGMVLARDGSAWLRRRLPPQAAALTGSAPGDYIVVPFDPGEPVGEVRLPPGFSPRIIWDDLVAGVLREPSGRQLVVIYRWKS